MATSNHITKVAVVGAGGRSGKHITESLLKTGKHIVTALTRIDSDSKLPDGITIKQIDYNKPETLVAALKGQDALVITLGGYAPKETQIQLIEAAGEAGVRWILPNEWSPDSDNEGIVKDVFVFQPKLAAQKAIKELSQTSYIAVSTGFWYEWSLAISPAFGIDLMNRAVTFFDNGDTKISVSTWPQVGRAVASLLSLPIKSSSSTQSSLSDFANQVVYVNSFTVSQRDMFASVLRVTDTKEDDWTITKENVKERYADGMQEIKEGKRAGFAKVLYGRVFFPDGCGDTEHNKSERWLNEVLGLPTEDIDEFTKIAIERAKSGDAWK